DDSPRVSLARAINDAHTATPDFLQDLIVANAPISIAHIDLIEHRLQRFRGLSIAAERALQHTIQTKPAPYARCRSTLFARCGTALNPHRIGDVARAHRLPTPPLLPEPRRGSAALHQPPPVSRRFARLLREAGCDNVVAVGEPNASPQSRVRRESWRASDMKHPDAPLQGNRSRHQTRDADHGLRIPLPGVARHVPPL